MEFLHLCWELYNPGRPFGLELAQPDIFEVFLENNEKVQLMSLNILNLNLP